MVRCTFRPAAPIGNCDWVRYVAYLFPFTVPITLLLFVIRVYAICWNKSYLMIFVFLSWLLVLGSAIAVAVHTEGISIDGTDFCTGKMQGPRDIADAMSTVTRFFHDTLVFIVTSWWLYKSNFTDNLDGFTGIVFGKHLVPLARSMLHDGQAYYLSVLLLYSN